MQMIFKEVDIVRSHRACHRGKPGEGYTSANTGLPAPVATLLPPNLRPVMPFACANVLPRLQVRQPETLADICERHWRWVRLS
jgi:hypothetical protein